MPVPTVTICTLVAPTVYRVCARTLLSVGAACVGALSGPPCVTPPTEGVYEALTPQGLPITFDPAAQLFRVVGSPGLYWSDGWYGVAVGIQAVPTIMELRRLMAGLPVRVQITYHDIDNSLMTPPFGEAQREVGLEQAPNILQVTLARRKAAGVPSP